jgi:hypothetical protein
VDALVRLRGTVLARCPTCLNAGFIGNGTQDIPGIPYVRTLRRMEDARMLGVDITIFHSL